VAQEVPDGDSARHQAGEPAFDGCVEGQPSFRHELQYDRGDERLRNAPDPEAVGRPHRCAARSVREPTGTTPWLVVIDQQQCTGSARGDDLVEKMRERRFPRGAVYGRLDECDRDGGRDRNEQREGCPPDRHAC
jgi:hypothetical protein